MALISDLFNYDPTSAPVTLQTALVSLVHSLKAVQQHGAGCLDQPDAGIHCSL